MKTKEFIKRVEELGYYVSIHDHWIDIEADGDEIIAVVDVDTMLAVDTDWCAWNYLPKMHKIKLFDWLMEYVKTPIDEREEPKKYYLRHKWIKSKKYNYLIMDIDGSGFDIGGTDLPDWSKTKFTREEIDEIKQKFNTDLSDFEEEEVEE